MEMLLSIAVWAGLFFLMMRFGCGAHTKGRDHKNVTAQDAQSNVETAELALMPGLKETDPVCQETISTATAKTSVHAGKVYYFCSRDCREIFEAAPDLYVGAGDTNQEPMEHVHV